MHPQTSSHHLVRKTAFKFGVGVLAIIGLGVVLYLLVIGAIVVGLVALCIIGAIALIARFFSNRR